MPSEAPAVYANEAYIAAKQTIPGAEVRETFEYDEDDGMDELPFAIGGRKNENDPFRHPMN